MYSINDIRSFLIFRVTIMINTVRMCNSSVQGKRLREDIIRILPDGDKNEGDERKRAARVRALLARSAGTRQKFLFALGHPTLRLRGREVTALQSAINDADKILGIHAIRVREEVQRRVVRVFALLCRAHRDAIILCEIYYERVVTTILGTRGNCDMYLF